MMHQQYVCIPAACRNRSEPVESSRQPRRNHSLLRPIAPLLLLLLFVGGTAISSSAAYAQVNRVVVIKVDGLPDESVDRFVRERDPRTGKSQLPWIEHVFYRGGTRLANFYTRGMSLSGPSWSLLDTGQHLQVKGNVEFDRFTLHSYDYLNFIPFYLANVAQQRVDMPGPELLDELGIPLLIDAYPYDERHQGFQLYQRGIRWTTLQRGLQNRISGRGPRELLDEWTMGLEGRDIVLGQLEREMIQKLNNPRIRYLDFYTTEFDHAAHHNRDRETQLRSLKDLDALVGRIWTAIEATPQADETLLVMVSDHGINTDEKTYSQGYNLVQFLGSRPGGGHHVVTKRRLLLDYSIKGFYPLVPLITTTTADSYYLKRQSTDYPTALLDFDGNERASIHLRDSDLNLLHILFQQLQRGDLEVPLRRAATELFFDTVDRRRGGWTADVKGLTHELDALQRFIEKKRKALDAAPKKWTKPDQDAGRDKVALRLFAQMDSAIGDVKEYSAYLNTLRNLLALRRETFQPIGLKIPDFIAKGAMGDQNTIYDLQHYVMGLAPAGLTLSRNGKLDFEKSFLTVDYFGLLSGISVRNNVQVGVDNHPIDFIATRIDKDLLAPMFPEENGSLGDCVWIYGQAGREALILSRLDAEKRPSFRYIPIADLKQDSSGKITFQRAKWGPGFPLRIYEDPHLDLHDAAPESWLSSWHSDLEWLRAVHKTAYSNALVGLSEQLSRHHIDDRAAFSEDDITLVKFRERQRRLVEADMLLLANNHWNFDVRGFNPGGNHGSFFRVSTHSTLMFAGGAKTGIPQGLSVDDPYDSLSFVPTIFALTGQFDPRSNGENSEQRKFAPFPGPVIRELMGNVKPGRRDPRVAEGDEKSN
jgi:hypothetical protein